MEGIKERRFPNDNLKRMESLKGNLYINPADPLYYEKILRYEDAHSAEAHYHVGMKHYEQGNREKALHHLRKSAAGQVPYAQMARAAIAEMENASAPAAKTEVEPGLPPSGKYSLPQVAVFVFLLLLMLMLLGTFHPGIRAVVSRYVSEPVGMSVVYEAGERPFYLYFDPAQSARSIEKSLYDEALRLGGQYPKDRIVLYGLYGSSADEQGSRIYPVTARSTVEHAFVTAQFHAESDSHVHIRFMHPDMEEEAAERRAKVQTAANLIRTALVQYREEHGAYPDSLYALTDAYPHNYLSFLPPVPGNPSQSSPHTQEGWLYEPSAESPEAALQPSGYSPVPFAPMEIIVEKETHTLRLVNGNYVLHQSEVGLGRQDRTPVGEFVVDQRVWHPQGREPGVYGTAALGFGAYAIHGTNEPASIGKNDSLGCVRLRNDEIESIFPYVPKGSHIRIVDKQPDAPKLLASAGYLPSVTGSFPAGETAGGQQFAWLH